MVSACDILISRVTNYVSADTCRLIEIGAMKARQSRKRPTSRDVAELAGVSRTTVSCVINERTGGNIRISDETRKRVWEAVNALNYLPVSAARTLRLQRSNMVVVMIPKIENLFYPQLATAIQHEARKAGLDVFILNTQDELQQEKGFLDVLIQRGVDGLFTQTFHASEADIDRLVDAGIAVVIHGDAPTHPFADNIVLDEARAAEEAVSYLIEKGHRRIGAIVGPATTWSGRLRRKGYVNALRTHNLSVEEELVYETCYERGCGALGMEYLLTLAEPPSAVFAGNDLLAIDALLFAVDAGLSVPGDVAVIGFDDILESTIVRPRLTTVHKDVGALGVAAVQMLVERIESESPIPGRCKVLDHKLVIRESA